MGRFSSIASNVGNVFKGAGNRISGLPFDAWMGYQRGKGAASVVAGQANNLMGGTRLAGVGRNIRRTAEWGRRGQGWAAGEFAKSAATGLGKWASGAGYTGAGGRYAAAGARMGAVAGAAGLGAWGLNRNSR